MCRIKFLEAFICVNCVKSIAIDIYVKKGSVGTLLIVGPLMALFFIMAINIYWFFKILFFFQHYIYLPN